MTLPTGPVVALCGGIGGAKLAAGLLAVLPPERLTLLVNTGDDFRHLGLWVSPDVDTVTYTLAGRANPQTGWGRAGESWRFMEALTELGGPDWFGMGDSDLATKAYRTHRLEEGARLTTVTAEIARALGLGCRILPVTDDPIPTMVDTDMGLLPFQQYFVRHRWQPRVHALRLDAAQGATATPEALAALRDPALGAVILCPSNPYLSIDPMLAVPGIREALAGCRAPRIAVSPLVGGAAIKGPLAKMMAELGLPPGQQAIAGHYRGLIDLLVADRQDRGTVITGTALAHAQTVMTGDAERAALAQEVLELAAGLTGARA